MMLKYTLLTTLAFHHLLIGSVLVIGLLALNKLVQSSPETRSWLWMTAFIISTAIPFTLFSETTTPQNTTANYLENTAPLNTISAPSSVSAATAQAANDNWHLPSEIVFNFSFLLSIGIALWALGSTWRAVGVLHTFIRTRRLISSQLTPIKSLSLNPDIDVFSSSSVASPMVVGLLKPKVILPQSILNELQHEQLIAIVLHEKAHIQRKDNWFSLFQELIVIIFWWSPITRFLNKVIHVEREIACDLRAVAKMNNNKQYAQSLVDCAKLMVDEKRNVLAMGLFSKKKELTYRVSSVLASKTKKIPNLTLVAISCFVLGATSLQAAQTFSPKISINDTASDARFYSNLSRHLGEQLLDAVKNNDIDTITALLNSGIDINMPVIGEGTALMIAVKTRNSEMAQTLIDLGADVNQASRFDGNPLIIAAKTNNLELAELLLKQGADVNKIVRRDETPLINASNRGHFEMIKYLVESGADVNLAVTTGIEDGFEVRSPLNRASNSKVKEYLIANGALEQP